MGLRPAEIGNRLSFWALAALAPVLMFVGANEVALQNYQTDLWHHLARGRAMVEQGRLVDSDIFTCTVAGESFRDPNWLTQVACYQLYTFGGVPFLRLINSLVLSAAMAVMVFTCWRSSGSLVLAAALGIFAFFGMWQLLFIRPQTFSLLLFALLYLILDLSENRRRWLFAVPFLFVLWANAHGAFPIGLYLIGSFFMAAAWEALFAEGGPAPRRLLRDRRVHDLALCLVFSLLATGINPYGFALYSYVSHTAGLAAQRRINEWLPPPLSLLTGKIWIASMLLAVVALVLPGRRPRVRDVFLILCFLPLPCGAVRMVPWWLLVSLPVVAVQFGAWLKNAFPEREKSDLSCSPLIGGAALAVLALLVGLNVPGPDRWLRPVPRDGTIENDLAGVAEHLRQVPDHPRNLFSRFEWGEYLGWTLQPDGCRVFVDGRIEIYPDDVWSDYLAVMQGQADWQEILDRYQVGALVLERNHSGLLPSLIERSGKWRRVCECGQAVLFLRVSGPPNGYD